MKTIEIDEDLFEFLRKIAESYDDTLGSVARTLIFGPSADRRKSTPENKVPINITDRPLQHVDKHSTEPVRLRTRVSKERKADLKVLVDAGLIRDGETVYLIDYQGNRVQQFSAVVSRSGLIYDRTRYSMSELAQKLLSKDGYTSTAVRGPAHWVNSDGRTIKELWSRCLNGESRK